MNMEHDKREKREFVVPLVTRFPRQTDKRTNETNQTSHNTREKGTHQTAKKSTTASLVLEASNMASNSSVVAMSLTIFVSSSLFLKC